MGTRRGQKPTLFLVVAGGSPGVLFPCASKVRYFLFGNPPMSPFAFLVTVILYFRMALGHDHFPMYHSLITYRYAGNSYRSLSGGLLHFIYIKIVPSRERGHGGSSGAAAEPLDRGGRRVARCSVPVCVRNSVYKSINITICFVSNRHCVSLPICG